MVLETDPLRSFCCPDQTAIAGILRQRAGISGRQNKFDSSTGALAGRISPSTGHSVSPGSRSGSSPLRNIRTPEYPPCRQFTDEPGPIRLQISHSCGQERAEVRPFARFSKQLRNEPSAMMMIRLFTKYKSASHRARRTVRDRAWHTRGKTGMAAPCFHGDQRILFLRFRAATQPHCARVENAGLPRPFTMTVNTSQTVA